MLTPSLARTRIASTSARWLRAAAGSWTRTSTSPSAVRTRVATAPPIAMRAAVAAAPGLTPSSAHFARSTLMSSRFAFALGAGLHVDRARDRADERGQLVGAGLDLVLGPGQRVEDRVAAAGAAASPATVRTAPGTSCVERPDLAHDGRWSRCDGPCRVRRSSARRYRADRLSVARRLGADRR